MSPSIHSKHLKPEIGLSEIIIPRNTLIVLCGPAASGKSTWAANHFLPTQVVSSDACRGMIYDDPADQSVTRQAFSLMHFIIEKRLSLGRLTVADATNLKRKHRSALNRIARRFDFNTAAVVFNVPLAICLARNAARERKVPEEAVVSQYVLLERTLLTLGGERFDQYHLMNEDPAVGVRVTRRVDRRSTQVRG